MDLMTLLGLLIGIGAILLGNSMEGGSIDFLIQPTAFVVVFGGTLGATMLQSCAHVFWRALLMMPKVLFRRQANCAMVPPDIWDWRRIMQSGDKKKIQRLMRAHKDPFIVKALHLLQREKSHEHVEHILEVELEQSHEDGMHVVQVYDSMGGYSPTIGIIGAILGLIQVMHNIADPKALGEGIAIAFVATIYGVGFANLIYLPIAEKMKALVITRSRYHEMVAAGIVSMVRGDNLSQVNNKLESYLSHIKDDIALTPHSEPKS